MAFAGAKITEREKFLHLDRSSRDIWDTDPNLKDRKNATDISKAYQQHVLGGIEWALGLKKSAAPANNHADAGKAANSPLAQGKQLWLFYVCTLMACGNLTQVIKDKRSPA